MTSSPPALPSPDTDTGSRLPRTSVIAGVLGAGLLLGSGGIHLDLYLTGYRYIPTIGWMFLLQGIAAAAPGLGALVLMAVPRPRATHGISLQQLATGSAALFAVATLGGYLLSLAVGLFGF